MAAAKRPAKKRVKGGSGQVSAAVRHAKFAEAWLQNGGNKTQAAIAAGCPAKSAHTQGNRLFNHEKVQAIIKKRQEKMFNNLEITTERLMLERARLAFYNPKALFDASGRRIPIHELPDDVAAAIAGFDIGEEGVKLKLVDKNPHLTSLEKQRGMYLADNEQNNPPPIEENHSKISDARAIAFILAEGMMLAKKKNAK